MTAPTGEYISRYQVPEIQIETSIVTFRLIDIINHLETLKADDIINSTTNNELIIIFNQINRDIDLIINRLTNYEYSTFNETISAMHNTVNRILNKYNTIINNDSELFSDIMDKLFTFEATQLGDLVEYRGGANIEEYQECCRFSRIRADNIVL